MANQNMAREYISLNNRAAIVDVVLASDDVRIAYEKQLLFRNGVPPIIHAGALLPEE